MPKQLQFQSFQDVKKAFQEKGIELLSDEDDWTDKKILSKHYFYMKTRVCNHEKKISWNNFKQDVGLNYCQQCYYQQHRVLYINIVKLFEKKGCKLLITEQEYNQKFMTRKTPLKFLGNCGHECKTAYIDLLQSDTNQRICISCIRKNQNQNSSQNKSRINLQFVQEICTNKNIQYVDTIFKNRRAQYVLKCPKEHEFKRTISQLKGKNLCSVCSLDTKQSSQQSVSTGDYHEQCVFNMLKSYCKSIQIVGNTGNLYDIIYTLDDNIKRGIQVKTLTRMKYKDNVFSSTIYRKENKQKYPKNTLFILINQKDNRFVADMSQNFSSDSVAIFFDSQKCKYQNTKFTDQNLFVQKLISLLPQVSKIDTTNQYSESIQKEVNCFERLQKKCQELGLSFQRNTTNGSCVDIFINNKAIQVKYCERDNKNNSVLFALYKSGGIKNGKQVHVPYNYKDEIQFFIFEYGGENAKYKNQYCILSKEFLMQKEYISNDNVKGKTTIYIWKPDSTPGKDTMGRKVTRSLQISEFWNKFDQLL